MENSNIKKQAKSDIFKELQPIIKFYIVKGASASSLKRYFKNTKMFNNLLDDIKYKSSNLINNDIEYKNLVRSILYEILDDYIAKKKDEEHNKKINNKMKHIKEFYSFQNEAGLKQDMNYKELN